MAFADMVHDLPLHLRTPAQRYPGMSLDAIVLADGEHYPQVVADAVRALQAAGWDVRRVVLLGGTEKLREAPDYGVPHVTGTDWNDAFQQGLAERPSWVLDVSDEPLLVFERRMQLIGAAARAGSHYAGADCVFFAPARARVSAPTLAVVGTGKRIGKTAIAGYVARVAREALAGPVVLVAMGRGGPREPIFIDGADGSVDVERLLAISRAGSHAASDYLEDAALATVATIGCRRAGGGLLGSPVLSNVGEGVEEAQEHDPALILLEGSGSCIPPVEPRASILLATTARPRDLLDDLGSYRLARADLLLVVGDDEAVAGEMLAAVASRAPELEAHAVRLVTTPIEPVDGQRVAVFTTAPEHAREAINAAMRAQGADVVVQSHALARRDELRRDIETALERGVDRFLVEIKAAGIDVVAEEAEHAGVPVTFLDNPPQPHDPSLDLAAAIRRIVMLATA